MDPGSAFASENIVMQNVYETLTRFNPPGSAELLSGVLAESWESAEDATVWTFRLREGVTFHDGSPLTADAVRASLQRTIDLNLSPAFILFAVESMEVVDDLTITINLMWPTPLDIAMSSNYGVYVMSPDSAGQEPDWFNAGNGAGTGPYVIESYSPVESTVLTRFDDYWGGWSDGQFDEVEIQLVQDPVLAEQLIRNGDADYTIDLPSDVYTSLESVDGVVVTKGQSMRNMYGLLNTLRLSPEVREALVLSFPYDDIVDTLFRGEGERSRGPIPQAVWGADPDLALPQTDLDRAAEILEDAGVSDLSVTYSYGAGFVEQQQIGEVWAANLSTIGVELVLEPLSFDARLAIAQTNPAEAQDIFMLFWFPTFVTPYDFLFAPFRSEESPFFNLAYYSNPDFDALIDDGDALTAIDQAAAIDSFQQALVILYEDNPAVFMIDLPNTAALRSDIDGYVPNPAYHAVLRFHELTRSSG